MGKNKAPSLKEGKARLVVEAVSNDLRASADTAAFDVDVVLTAPRVIPDDAQHYINQGGMELVTFTPSGSWSEAGVKVGPYSFRSFPLPGHPGPAFFHVRVSLGPAGRRHAAGVCAQPGGNRGDGALLVQAVSQKVPRARFPLGRRVDGEAGELRRPYGGTGAGAGSALAIS